MDTISFPKLGLEFNISSTAFTVFNLEIKWYGIMITLGVCLAIWYALKRSKKFGLVNDAVFDVAFIGIIFGFIGARAYYVLFNLDNYKSIADVINVRNGGLAIYGGIIGAVCAGFIAAKIRKVKIFPLLDLAGLGFLIGQGIGRWGNFFNQEAFGLNTKLPWGMTGNQIKTYIINHRDLVMDKYYYWVGEEKHIDPKYILDYQENVHPCFLYESLWCALGFVLLHFYSKKRKFDGEVFLAYVSWYGLGRFFIEGLRTDSLYAGNFKVSQVLAIVSAVIAAALIVVIRIRLRKNNEYTLYCDTEESQTLILTHQNEIQARKDKKEGNVKVEGGTLGISEEESEMEIPAETTDEADNTSDSPIESENTDENKEASSDI